MGRRLSPARSTNDWISQTVGRAEATWRPGAAPAAVVGPRPTGDAGIAPTPGGVAALQTATTPCLGSRKTPKSSKSSKNLKISGAGVRRRAPRGTRAFPIEERSRLQGGTVDGEPRFLAAFGMTRGDSEYHEGGLRMESERRHAAFGSHGIRAAAGAAPRRRRVRRLRRLRRLREAGGRILRPPRGRAPGSVHPDSAWQATAVNAGGTARGRCRTGSDPRPPPRRGR